MRYLLVLMLAGALLGQRAETLLQAAVKKETVDGDLAGAIGEYKKALSAAKGDRAVAAKALYGMAQCYRKQGDAQARAALERVVREYGDQPVAGQARLQLSVLTAETRPGGIRLQKLFDGDEYGCSSVSANGRMLGCALGYTKEAAVYDTVTGRFRVLTELRKETPANRHVGTFAISPDGKWLAFHTYRSGGVMSELQVVPADGSGGTKTVYRDPQGQWIDVHAWTPDGREILFSVLPAAPGGPVPVMTVPAAGGAARQLRTVPVRPQWLHTAYSPDGKWIAVKQPKGIQIWNAAGEASALGATGGMRIVKTRVANNMDYGCSSVSADGRLLGCALRFVDEAAVYDIPAGQMRVLTEFRKAPPAERRFINTYAVSPDGKWMAFHNYRDGAKANEISIIATDGAGGVRTVYKHPEDCWLDLHGWTPDSREVVLTVAANRVGGPRILTVAAIAGGTSRAVREHRADLQHSFTPVSPDGKWIAVVNGENVELWPMDGSATTVKVGPAIDMDAVAGWTPDGKSLLLIASDGHRGDLVQYPIVDGRPAGTPRRIRTGAEGLGSSKGIDASGTLHFSASFPDSDIFGLPFDTKTGSAAGPEVLLSTRVPRRQAFGAWSPDGKTFSSWTFHSYHNMSIQRPQLILKPLGGGPETIVTPERHFDPYSLPVWDRDSKSLLVIIPGDETGQKRVAHVDPVTGKFEAVTRAVPARNIGYTPAFSPDLRYLYQRGQDQGLVRVDVRTGETKSLYSSTGRAAVRGPAVSPDGKTVAFFANPEGKRLLYLMDAETGAVRNVEMEAEGGWGAWAIAFSPDSRWVVWTKFGDHRSDVRIVPADGSAPQRVLVPEGIGMWKHLSFSPDGKMLSFTRDVYSADMWSLTGFLGGAK